MKTNQINILIKVIIAIILMILLCYIYSIILSLKDENLRLRELYSNVEDEVYANIEDYTIYGNHLNFNGYFMKEDLPDISVEKIRVVIKGKNGYYEEILATLSESIDKYNFNISKNINGGIDLNKLNEEDIYLVFIKVSGNDTNGKYIEKMYSITDLYNNEKLEYYTITKDGKNSKIDISFEDRDGLDVMILNSVNTKLPDDVYDFVIDAGHGGKDPGAMYKGYKEAELTLEYSKILKDKLEQLGYKVKLTRSEDKYVESYGKNSRSAVPFETKSKLVLSIHLNSSYYDDNDGGVEIYAPNHANLSLAKNFADNIVQMANSSYSINSSMRSIDGVYVRTFTQKEIDDFRIEAQEEGYPFYETITTDTNYLFMIRETGGKITGAYTDGRNLYGSNNQYKDSNIAAEAYLLELGFINSSKDLEKLINNKEGYVDAIVKSLVENYN